ncbi:uncharacterized protein B0H18DRAFT_1051473 [Fomitopsis serialis]|uniref:uncharacterized protein n=1 Tax=Fomitopsis serialis TaxID=139415 RepID=UPI0020072D0A|nr:uncharacterized protein B0H18DRAFT_1051473 [Neoantrodia serialis]KAH9912874.1 hypothetical protein B0H18DRAFT_1051473 [Neoantrodia serialis]
MEFVVRTTDHEDGTSAPRDDCEVVPNVPHGSASVLRDDLAVVPLISQYDMADVQYCTSDVPHHPTTGCRVAGTPQMDVPTSTLHPLPAPIPTSVATNVKFVVRMAGQEDGMFTLPDDLLVVLSDTQGRAPVLEDDREVVHFNAQGGTMDQQRCRSEMPHPASTVRCAARTSSLPLDVHGAYDHPSSIAPDFLSGSYIARPPATQHGLHVLTEVQGPDWPSAAEPPLVQLAESWVHLDDRSSSPQSRAAAFREELYSQPEVRAPGSVKTAEHLAVQLTGPQYDLDLLDEVLDLNPDLLSSHHRLRDPGASASAQPDACVAPTNTRVRDCEATTALPTVQQPALTDSDRPERLSDRQPDENFTVLIEGSILGTPTKLPITSFAAPDIGGDYERRHESELVHAPRRSSAGRTEDQGGVEVEVEEIAEAGEAEEEGQTEGREGEGHGVGKEDKLPCSEDKSTPVLDVPPPLISPPLTPSSPLSTATTTTLVVVAITVHNGGTGRPRGDLQVAPGTARHCGTIGERVCSSDVSDIFTAHAQTTSSSLDIYAEVLSSGSNNECLKVLAAHSPPPIPLPPPVTITTINVVVVAVTTYDGGTNGLWNVLRAAPGMTMHRGTIGELTCSTDVPDRSAAHVQTLGFPVDVHDEEVDGDSRSEYLVVLVPVSLPCIPIPPPIGHIQYGRASDSGSAELAGECEYITARVATTLTGPITIIHDVSGELHSSPTWVAIIIPGCITPLSYV